MNSRLRAAARLVFSRLKSQDFYPSNPTNSRNIAVFEHGGMKYVIKYPVSLTEEESIGDTGEVDRELLYLYKQFCVSFLHGEFNRGINQSLVEITEWEIAKSKDYAERLNPVSEYFFAESPMGFVFPIVVMPFLRVFDEEDAELFNFFFTPEHFGLPNRFLTDFDCYNLGYPDHPDAANWILFDYGITKATFDKH